MEDMKAAAIAMLDAAEAPNTTATTEKDSGNSETAQEAVAEVAEAPVEDKGSKEAPEAASEVVSEEKHAETSPSVDPAVEVKFAKHFAALARKEKANRLKVEQAEAARNEAAQRLATMEARVAKAESMLSALKSGDPVGALVELGVNFEELTKRALGQIDKPEETAIAKAERKLAEVEAANAAKWAELERHEAEQRAQHAAAAVARAEADYKAEILRVISSSDEYALCASYNAVDDIFDVVTEHYNQTKAEGAPEILTPEQAAKLVEDYHQARADKAFEVRAKKAEKSKQTTKQVEQGPSKKSKALSNKGADVAPERVTRDLTAAERRALAIRQLADM